MIQGTRLNYEDEANVGFYTDRTHVHIDSASTDDCTHRWVAKNYHLARQHGSDVLTWVVPEGLGLIAIAERERSPFGFIGRKRSDTTPPAIRRSDVDILCPGIRIQCKLSNNSSAALPIPRAQSVGSKIEGAIKNIQDGWAGPGSIGPLAGVISDLRIALSYLDATTAMPDIELDDTSGVLTISWTSQSMSFNLIFDGTRHVMGVFSQVGGSSYRPWRLSVNDRKAILQNISVSPISILLKRHDLSAVFV